jgi:hypothetical protein
MEQILKVLRQLMGTAGMLGSVPKPIKVAMMYFGAFVGVVCIFKFAKLGPTEKTFLIIALVLLGLITAGYYGWKAWKQKQQNQQFGGEISQHSSATPRGLSDPGQRARLDDMRKKFQSGVDAYKSRGKDLYKLPWYVIVGEPGSGKTEAVRHSNVGFPPGMQDEFQGVGGTINMNWWFTNHAVLLDTAGRLMFDEVKPGETSEWKEFLNLLKKNRPNCPINGLFLVIPSDSLIKDSADAIQKKAGKIAQQLDVIQRVLDVRFPVFVVVTKCDKINGFREFFDGLTDPHLQHQMMGWSNPDPLDEPFKPEMVDKHLEQVAVRLRRRRLGLLRDPVPENSDSRRTDEVDSLYALPHSLELLSSRLRRYLETIFIAGEWSAKPLFLRGIYFSSSMREGSALDAELAEAIGVGVEDLPEGKVWERERAYFLRDLFLEKVFREKGLVTRASNTKRMLRGQQVALYGFGFVALAVFLAVAWFAMGSLHSGGVKDQGDYWQAVSDAGWNKDKYWKQSIVPMRNDGSFVFLITNTIVVDKKPITLGEFHVKLRELAEKQLPKNFLFPGLADKYNRNSRRAQRIVFEAGVVRPLIEATRQKMSQDDGSFGLPQQQVEALVTLIQLEADILTRGTSTNKPGTLSQEGAKGFLSALQNYVVGSDVPVDTNLVAVMAWTYSTNDTAKGSWPPQRFSGGLGGTNTLAANAGINAGLQLFVQSATNIQRFQADWNQISWLHASVRTFATNETALFIAAEAGKDDKFLEAHRAVEMARTNLVEQLGKAGTNTLFAGGVFLTNGYQRFRTGVTNSAGAALDHLKKINDDALAVTQDYPLFKDIKKRLDYVETALSDRVTQLLKGGDMKEFQTLDETCLADDLFIKRANLYSQIEKRIARKWSSDGRLVNGKGKQLDDFKAEIHMAREDVAKLSGKLTNQFTQVIGYQTRRAEKAFFESYLAEVKEQLRADGGFPLVRDTNRMMTEPNFKTAARQLKYISDDLLVFTTNAPRDGWWTDVIDSVRRQQAIARALLGEEGRLGYCTVSLAADAQDAWRVKWRNIKLTFDGGGSGWIRTQTQEDEKLTDALPVQNKLELLLQENVGATTLPSKGTAAWGTLWLIHEYNGEPDKGDLKTWLVKIPVWAPEATGVVRLKLKFDRPLPQIKEWAMP